MQDYAEFSIMKLPYSESLVYAKLANIKLAKFRSF